MGYEKYKKIAPPAPVAVRLDQTEDVAPGHAKWGIVTCDRQQDRRPAAYGRNRVNGSWIWKLRSPRCVWC